MGSFLLFMAVCAIIAAAIGGKKNEAGIGCMLGFLLGPLGILMAILSDGDKKPCRFCREKIDPAATVCPHCQREQPAATPSEPVARTPEQERAEARANTLYSRGSD